LAGSSPAALLPESAAPFTAPETAPAAAPVSAAVTAFLALVRKPGRFFPDFFVLFLLTLRFLVVDFRATVFLPEAFAVPFLAARPDLMFLLADFLAVFFFEVLAGDFFEPDFLVAFVVGMFLDPPIKPVVNYLGIVLHRSRLSLPGNRQFTNYLHSIEIRDVSWNLSCR
jgi:hypothetical protein